MASVTIEEAQAQLPELIACLSAGEPLFITRDQQPVACLLAADQPLRTPRRPGSAKGILEIVVEDDEHLDAFQEYME